MPQFPAAPLLLVAALIGAESAPASDLLSLDKLQFHGFASQGVVRSSDVRYYGDSPNTAFELTELGLNASYQAHPRLLLSGQILSRRAGDMYDGSPSLDFGLADLALLSDSRRSLGIRLGRIKNPLGLYNETRDVPFTRPGIFLPQVVYFDKVRNLLLSSDGAMVYGELYDAAGTLSLHIARGLPIVDANVEWTLLGADFDGRLKSNGAAWLGSLWYATPTERFKLGVSGWEPSYRYAAGTASEIASGEIDTPFWVASAQYNAEDWTLSAEYCRIPVQWRNFGDNFPFRKQHSQGWYLQGAYRLRPTVELMVRYEEGYADRNDPNGKASSERTGGVTPPFDFFSKIFTAGIRWDPQPYLMLRAEYQRHNGTFATSFRENPDPTRLRQHWDVIAASISLRF